MIRKRAQIGAHYTDREKIMMIVEPVIIEPLAEWVEKTAQENRGGKTENTGGEREGAQTEYYKDAEDWDSFIERLKNFRVLDPACGSGNFLYLALKALKDIEFRVNLRA